MNAIMLMIGLRDEIMHNARLIETELSEAERENAKNSCAESVRHLGLLQGKHHAYTHSAKLLLDRISDMSASWDERD